MASLQAAASFDCADGGLYQQQTCGQSKTSRRQMMTLCCSIACVCVGGMMIGMAAYDSTNKSHLVGSRKFMSPLARPMSGLARPGLTSPTDLARPMAGIENIQVAQLQAQVEELKHDVIEVQQGQGMTGLFGTFVAVLGMGIGMGKVATNTIRSSRSRLATVTMSATIEDPNESPLVETLTEIFITVLRLGTCALMVHHGLDKIQNVDGFSANVVAKFFGFLPGPPQFWTLSAAFTQVAGAALLSIGVFTRPTAAAMSATMITAVVFHLLNTGPEDFPLGVPKAHSYNFELAAMYVFVLAYFTVAGAGKFSIDEQVLGGELDFYGEQLDKVFGDKE